MSTETTDRTLKLSVIISPVHSQNGDMPKRRQKVWL